MYRNPGSGHTTGRFAIDGQRGLEAGSSLSRLRRATPHPTDQIDMDDSDSAADDAWPREVGRARDRAPGVPCMIGATARGEGVPVMATPPSRLPAIVARAQAAAGPWGKLRFRQRSESLVRLRDLVSQESREIAKAIARGTGKPLMDALQLDVAQSIVTLDACIAYATDARADQPVSATVSLLPGLLGAYGAALLPCTPGAVVCVIAPVRSPFQLALTPAVLSLAVGNAVIVKPSSSVPRVAELLDWLLDEALAHFPGLAQIVPGSGAVGAALAKCDGVDAVLSAEPAPGRAQG
jgi:acyl-CoA reductase-like NAD-dependent aldehyde dehydrogenase